jgi:uncharacterized protein (TIGR02118 family)
MDGKWIPRLWGIPDLGFPYPEFGAHARPKSAATDERTAVYKLFAVWTHPDDVEEFEKYYAETHAPLAAAIPGLQRLVLTRTSDFLGDGPAPFHRIAELWFEDADALEIAKESPELEAAADDVSKMEERFNVVLHSPAGVSVDAEIGPYTP